MDATLSPQVFAILSALVEERLGLHYGSDDRETFGDKIANRAREAGFESALDYYYFLRYDASAGPELDALADALVIGETYFFRELEPLRAAVTELIAPVVRTRGSARVWCAGCATGEEPLSFAMVLEEMGLQGRCEILATDLSARALAKAREGLYGARSMRALPPNEPPAGFSERLAAIASASLVGGPRFQASRELVEDITYRQLNLLDDASIVALGTFDLIICRNVLIYFADATVTRVGFSLARALATDGRLLIGASESLLRFGTVLRGEERSGSFFYTREAT